MAPSTKHTPPPPRGGAEQREAGGGKPPASAKPAGKPASKPPADSPPPRKKRSWLFWPKVILLLLVIAAGAAVYYLPQHVEKLSGVKIPAFVPSAAKAAEARKARVSATVVATDDRNGAQSAPPPPASLRSAPSLGGEGVESAPAPTPAPVPEPAPRVEIVTVTQTDNAAMAETATRIRQLRTAVAAQQQELRDLQERLRESELQNSQLAAQVAALSLREGSGAELQTQVIALQLKISGDTAAAAQRLKLLAASLESAGMAQTLLDEAARLETVPPRAALLAILDGALSPAVDEEWADGGGITGGLQRMFNIRRTPAAGIGRGVRAQLAQLHLHLLTQREDAYWQLLQKMRGSAQGAEVTALLDELHALGAPDTQLRW